MISGIGRRLPSLLGLALLSLLAAEPGWAAELEVYQPRHRAAAELAPLAEGLLGSSGTVVADPRTGKLVLSGSAAAIKRTLRALRELDVPLGNYRIEARETTEQELRQRGFELHGWLELGDLRIGRIRSPAQGARVVFRTSRTEGAKLLLANLLVLEGHTAEIWTGTTHPVRLRVFEKRDTGEQIFETTPLVSIRSGFRLRPRRRQDGSVELEIAAMVEEDGPRGSLRQTAADTRVTLQPGEEIVIAEIRREHGDILTSPFVTYQQEAYTDDTLVWVRVSPADSDQ